MKLQLILADRCVSCRQTERLWRALSEEHGLPFQVLSLARDRTRALTRRLGLNTFPALLVDGKVRAVGSPSRATAHELLRRLLDAGGEYSS